MGLNKSVPHLIILTEDEADREIVLGFLGDPRIDQRRVQPLPPSGGWTKVKDEFLNRLTDMTRYPDRNALLIIDCDGHDDRIGMLLPELPAGVRDRVFVLGSLYKPEKLTSAMKMSKEAIGRQLAMDCAEGTDTVWSHPQLTHNMAELMRLNEAVVPFLIPDRRA
jgi:hypothetical protein